MSDPRAPYVEAIKVQTVTVGVYTPCEFDSRPAYRSPVAEPTSKPRVGRRGCKQEELTMSALASLCCPTLGEREV